jgi:diguanylate cyclase (GGDEF)-like protein/PAS domain S-box-containing protein
VGADGVAIVPIDDEIRVRRPSGEQRWVAVQVAPLAGEEDEVVANVATMEDITERVLAERDSERLTDIFEATRDIVGIADATGRLLYLNASARSFLGLAAGADIGGVSLQTIFGDERALRLIEDLRPQLLSDGMWSGEVPVPDGSGRSVPMLAQLLVHRDEDGRVEFYSGVLHDISERKRFETELAHQATHDPLTGLPNRSLLLQRLEHALARARRQRSRVAVLFLDLDHFKVVNDSLGHDLGDQLLVTIAERLREALRPSDTVARFGGDEFVVLCEDLVGRRDAEAVAERVHEAISGPFTVDDREVFVGVSIGIAFPDAVPADGGTLIRDADAAMYQAKARGRSRWEVFDHDMRGRAVDRLDIENALRRALERRELRIHYQPIVSLETGTIRSVEALVRWEHPERGLLLPDEFIAVAEETGVIVPIGAWVLEQACRQVERWRGTVAALDGLSLAVNLSGRQLGDPALVDTVERSLVASGMPANQLQLEITESVLMDDVEASQETLVRLRGLGVRLGIDDFGTGYSSMSYLRRFPVDVLKVDRSFVDGLGHDASDSAIVNAIVTLAHTLGLAAVGEGVETYEQLAELRRLGCDFAQGYLISRPGAGEEVGEMLGRHLVW